MKKLLIFIDWYEPGFKAGGPIRSVVNFVHVMKNEMDLYVFTSDRDLGDEQPYEGVVTDEWIRKDGIHIFYAGPRQLNRKKISEVIKNITPDSIYLNSMFSKYFTIYPLILTAFMQSKPKVILAPRGMLRQSALAHKSLKKSIFIYTFRLLGIHKRIAFQATDETEVKDIGRVFPVNRGIELVANLPGLQLPYHNPENKKQGYLRLIFVGRVHPIKNLDYVFKALAKVRAEVNLTIVAATDDKIYEELCRNLLKTLPANISIQWFEDLPHAKLEELLKQQHVFILPTKGENFGHSIFESLSVGRPVIISDQTPWRGLESHQAGFDISLEKPEDFIFSINKFAGMDAPEHEHWCRGAWNFCNKYISSNNIKAQYLKLFN